MKNQTVVIGLGLFGREIAVGMSRLGHAVLAIDKSTAALEPLRQEIDQVLALDSTDEQALYEARVERMDVAVCAIGAQNIEASILTTSLLHQLGVPRVIARAADDLHARILRQVGADEVVNPEKQMGRRIAVQIATLGMQEVLRLAADVCVARMPVPLNFFDRSLLDLNPRQKYSINVIAVQRGSSNMLGGMIEARPETDDRTLLGSTGAGGFYTPGPDFIFRDGDIMLVAGHESDLERLAGSS